MGEKISIDRLREVLDYNPINGQFIWKVRPSHNSRRRIGDVAGGLKKTGKNFHWYIGIDGKDFLGSQLAWFWVKSVWPLGRLAYVNKDPSDLRIENLTSTRTMAGTQYEWSSRISKSEYEKGKRKLYPEHFRQQDLRKDFGIDLAEYQKMFVDQSGVCAICFKPETQKRGEKVKWLAVDHDHTTGAIRGLLCCACNQAVGKFEEDIDVMESAIRYLKNYQDKSRLDQSVALLEEPPNG